MIAEILEITLSQAINRAQFDHFEPILADLKPFLAEVLRHVKKQQAVAGNPAVLQSQAPPQG